jgi:hypothetical protein
MAKIAVFVDHDIMVRHFILNGVLPGLEPRHDVVFVFPDRHKRVKTDPATLPVRRHRTIPISDQRAYDYRRLYVATVLRRLRHTRDRKPLFRFWRDALGREAYWESWLHSWPGLYQRYRRRMLARIGDNPALDALLREERPDVIIHPTVLEGLFVSDLVRAGEAHGIPTVYLMNSWDNPAVKAMMLGAPDRLAVWGEHSRQLAHERLGLPHDRLVILGAAQFDGYRSPPREAPADYRRRLGVPEGHRLLLYAGSSKGLDEVAHLVRLEQAIEAGQLPRTLVLFRPHPWRGKPAGEEDFFGRPWKHVIMAPDMADYYRKSRTGEVQFYLADYADTHVTLSAVDAVISPLSTILLEAAMHGKPSVAYLPDEDMRTNSAMFTMVRTVHFRTFFEKLDCIQCGTPEALVADTRRLLDQAGDPALAERIRRQSEFFVTLPPRPYTEMLADLVRSLVPASAPAPSAAAGS